MMNQDRLFQNLKLRLMRTTEVASPGRLRFVAIQYVCSFSRISPYEMAVALANDGFEILFDNSACSKIPKPGIYTPLSGVVLICLSCFKGV